MKVLARSLGRLAVVAAVVLCFVLVGAGGVSAATLPNPCTLLTKVHPERAFGHGKTLAVTHRVQHKYGSGALANLSCSETVGTQPVSINLSAGAGGFGGVKITSETHPTGLGAGALLIVGTGLGGGGPVDFVEFHTATIYVSISANGASPATLTAFARLVYKAIR